MLPHTDDDIDLDLGGDDIPTLESKVMNRPPHDYVKQAQELAENADDKLKSKTTKSGRILIGFCAFVSIIIILAVADKCLG